MQSHFKTIRQSMPNFSNQLKKDFYKKFVDSCRQRRESVHDAAAVRGTGVEKTAKDSMEPFKRILQTLEA